MNQGNSLFRQKQFSKTKAGNLFKLLTKTSYRILTNYIEILTVLKTTKKSYTLEAVLHNILTFYFGNSEEGREAVKKTATLFS